MNLQSKEEAIKVAREILLNLHSVPYACVNIMSVEGFSIYIAISLDKQEDWACGIFENSQYARFVIHPEDGKLSLLSSGGKHLAKFRKCNAVSVENVTEKIKDWVEKSNQLLGR